jgi:hypothetical protein
VQVFTSEHSIATTTYYYSTKGELRFVFSVSDAQQGDAAAVHTFVHEKRVYFNSEGQVFWEVDREGVGTNERPDLAQQPFTTVEEPFKAPAPDVEEDPNKAFGNPIACF